MNYCNKCGNKLRDIDAFCVKCGKKVESDLPIDVTSEVSKQNEPKITSMPMTAEPKIDNSNNQSTELIQPKEHTKEQPIEPTKIKNKLKPILIILPITLIILVLSGISIGMFLIPHIEYTRSLKEAVTLSESGDYKAAIDAARYAVELKPKSEKALEILNDVQAAEITAKYGKALKNAKKLLGDSDYENAIEAVRLALSFKPEEKEALEVLNTIQMSVLESVITEIEPILENGQFDKAYNLLKELSISAGDQTYDLYNNYLNALLLNPYIKNTDASEFPVVTALIGCTGNLAIDKNNIVITENGSNIDIMSADNENGTYNIKFMAHDIEDWSEFREYKLSLTINGLTLPLNDSYNIPSFEYASVNLVATDISNYPIIRAYFRINDEYGRSIEQLKSSSFTINESIYGGTYLEREVRSAVKLSQTNEGGINICLAADKSDSIEWSDMDKIKQVMIEFVKQLRLGSDDKAEVIAFDTIVKVMASYTNDKTRLINGINNMSTDGMTAFYDAVYNGIHNVTLQGGARCVIAFTDGMDNMSYRNHWDTIDYANEKQVPLYIIGVGYYVDAYNLQTMAEQTGGKYWHINDLYDLEEIYKEIYTDLQELYVVEYISDSDADMLDSRTLKVNMRGAGYKGECSTVFTPAATAETNRANSSNTSRYEIFVEDVSWEEACQKSFEKGGHLVTITSKDEQKEIIKLAESVGVTYVWIGGYTSYDDYGNVFGHWITGEPFSYSDWSDGQPSRLDLDSTPEWYIMLWNVKSQGGWSWNDQRNDIIADLDYFKGKIAYVCEYE